MERVISEPGCPSNPHAGKIRVVQGDITKQDVDAIAALIPLDLEYRGSLNDAILKAAGERMDEFLLENIYQPRPGDVYAIPGFNLPCKHILFCVMPKWRTDFDRHDRFLLNAARKTVEMAWTMSLRSIAFPPLAMGKKGYPPARAARLIVQGICERVYEEMEDIRIVCPEEKMLKIFRERLKT